MSETLHNLANEWEQNAKDLKATVSLLPNMVADQKEVITVIANIYEECSISLNMALMELRKATPQEFIEDKMGSTGLTEPTRDPIIEAASGGKRCDTCQYFNPMPQTDAPDGICYEPEAIGLTNEQRSTAAQDWCDAWTPITKGDPE